MLILKLLIHVCLIRGKVANGGRSNCELDYFSKNKKNQVNQKGKPVIKWKFL